MSLLYVLDMALTIVLVVVLSVYSGKSAKKNKGANSWVVAGAITGTLVGGASTVGTAQLAYEFGMSAWWYTLGGGISCIVLALVYAKPFNRSGHNSVFTYVTDEYGAKNGVLASVFSSAGNFISLISQMISATAVIAVVCPEVRTEFALLFTAGMMVLYVIFGGVKGSGIVGVLKMVLLYSAMILAGITVLKLTKGLSGFTSMVNNIENPDNVSFFSMFKRGAGKDLGSCLSLLIGVVTSQSYAQPLFIAADSKKAVKGALLSAALIPPIGIGGILVGLYMRATHPGILSKTALTLFVTENFSPLIGGIIMGTLLITVIGSGAGLALGVVKCIKNDVMTNIARFNKITDRKSTERFLIVIVLFFGCIMSMGGFGDTILNFAFMSMGLRGAAVFIPLNTALWLKSRVNSGYICAAIIAAPITVLIFNLVKSMPFDPLFAGVFVSALISMLGFFCCQRKKM